MLGYDVNWAPFHIIEIHLKIVGYLVAAQSFHEDTNVLMLTTNLIKKDLSPSPVEDAITMNRLSSVVTPDVARDIRSEVFIMLNHSHPHIRKRAVLTLYRVCEKYLEALPQDIIRLQERLDDPDPGVVSAMVNFGSLSPHEPWLVRRLQPSITDLISTTTAIPLLYECVHTCIIGNMLREPSGLSLAQTCISKLADQNHRFKYIALLALVKIMPTHVDLVAEHHNIILASVDDDDISIRMRALELVTALVNKHNLQAIVQQLFSHLVQPQTLIPSAVQSLSQHVVPSILLKAPSAPSHSPAYHLWDLSVLVDLTYISGVDVGAQIHDQLVDVVERVWAVRAYAVKLMVKLLSDETLLVHAGEPGSCSEVLWAAAWICGEYYSELLAPEELLPYLLHSEVTNLDLHTKAMDLQAATKVFGYWSTEAAQQWTDDLLDKVKGAVDSVMELLEDFVSSPHIVVQEQVNGYSTLLSVFDTLIHPLFSAYELNPVASAAQASVPVPEGLSLDTWIVPSIQVPVHDEHESEVLVEKKVKKKSKKGKEKESSNGTRSKGMKKKKEDEEVLVPLEESETPEEIAERERDPYHIIDDQTSKLPVNDADSIPIIQLDELPPPTPKVEPRLFALKSSSARSSSPRFVSRSAPITRQQMPSLFDNVRASTPEPIKVTKAKRKGTGTGKKCT
ncbi:armadillo-type protein, partial [Pisolithus microcarpus]